MARVVHAPGREKGPGPWGLALGPRTRGIGAPGPILGRRGPRRAGRPAGPGEAVDP
jgi:hypothetical protein